MTNRQRLMFANGIVLGLFAVPSFFMDIRAIFFGEGPLVTALRGVPSSGIGFLEAHGLAALFAFWFLYVGRTQASPARACRVGHSRRTVARVAWDRALVVAGRDGTDHRSDQEVRASR